jgi:hypothetical protein
VSDSDERRASVELVPSTWHAIIRALLAVGLQVSAEEIREQLPKPLPRNIGAVIEARRFGEASTQIYVRNYPDALGYSAWRHAEADGRWVNSDSLEVVRVLSPGVDL